VKERKKSADLKLQKETEIPVSVFKDKIFWIFLFVCFITACFFSSYSLRYRYITTKIWINGISKWAFIILEWIADFLLKCHCEFHQKKKHKPTGLFWVLADVP
jgi:hypothetical protein